MDLKIVLDFDGVLFNSAYEAWSVCNRVAVAHPGHRDDVGFEEFLEFRSVVTDAWQYNRLYAPQRRLRDIAELPGIAAEAEDWEFARRFFAARAEMMADPDWPKIMAPYDFFFQLKPLLAAFPHRFAILSTRNRASIQATMAFFGADVVAIFGQEDIRGLGSKLAVAEAQGWLAPGAAMVAYVDDMNIHLEPFEGMIHLPLHADWGYDRSNAGSLNQHQVLAILKSLLKLAEGAPA